MIVQSAYKGQEISQENLSCDVLYSELGLLSAGLRFRDYFAEIVQMVPEYSALIEFADREPIDGLDVLDGKFFEYIIYEDSPELIPLFHSCLDGFCRIYQGFYAYGHEYLNVLRDLVDWDVERADEYMELEVITWWAIDKDRDDVHADMRKQRVKTLRM